ncbi:aminotransferase class I/II-fold pyridoxal phosphate-dependent enzyme [Conexibacter stalactiti]|uniref:8-amino-7-oxononanoate synthase n=1 Tax=Conexibacter stalactiti TaxID=1940611 RepID=A0ABU4HUL5_9ACTN|nr:aminotransferase class I/II-fold pyridoxal phosphate-dependent enzyme [Conexibacter stalactiti]MDW5595729.1 aminotransferase class I/II-fold pyridoxal phosphate-dependent enzyme [Conexibacter stalactiti]MEC5036371.1 aminotransferase class I/II-fold pyridoxal phosphate-dependent enzyme [Conexibacter stalactiti]
MNATLATELSAELAALDAAGTRKRLRPLGSPQGPLVRMAGHGDVLVLSSNDYLGLAAHPEVVEAGIEGLRRYGAGTASVRFICGLFDCHLELEQALAGWVGTEAALTFTSAWAANEAAIGALCAGRETWVLSDELNHASIVDAIRRARPAGKRVYAHADMAALEAALREVPAGVRRVVVSDGVFSMEGDLVPLPRLVELCRAHDAVLVLDDSHGTGVLGERGRGTPEQFGLLGEVDVIVSTLGKALGGAAGGFVAGSRELCAVLEQRARPQLFSNALPPTVACSALAALRVLEREPQRVARLRTNAAALRDGLAARGLRPLPGDSGIVPVIVGETATAVAVSERLLARGLFVTGFGHPVVPEGTARVRLQASAALSAAQVQQAIEAVTSEVQR